MSAALPTVDDPDETGGKSEDKKHELATVLTAVLTEIKKVEPPIEAYRSALDGLARVISVLAPPASPPAHAVLAPSSVETRPRFARLWRVATLGAPKNSEVAALNAVMVTRFKDKDEEFAQYVQSVIDRQVSKASGLLSVNALLLAAMTLSSPNDAAVLTAHPLMVRWSCVLLLISAMLCFEALFVAWGQNEKFASAVSDAEGSLEKCAARTWTLNLACLLGLFVVVMCLGVFLASVLGLSILPNVPDQISQEWVRIVFGIGLACTAISWWLRRK